MELAGGMEERDGLLVASLLQLVSYFTTRIEGDESMRQQLIVLCYEFGGRPKDIASAANISPTRVHQVVKEQKEAPSQHELRERALQILASSHDRRGKRS
jgi:hypothetical protein